MTTISIPTTTVTVTDSGTTVALTTTTTTASVEVGTTGPQGATGEGVPAGGATGEVLVKTSATDYATAWDATPTGITVAESQVTGLTSALAGKAPIASPTFTGVVSLPDGTVGSPSLQNTGDTNTGVFFPADNNIALVTDGIARLSIDSAGLVTGTGTSYGAWTTSTPTVTANSGTFTSATAAARYCRIGKTVHFTCRVSITTNGTAAGHAIVALPFTAATGTPSYQGAGREGAVTGKMLQALIINNTALVRVRNADDTYPGANGYQLDFTITYEAA